MPKLRTLRELVLTGVAVYVVLVVLIGLVSAVVSLLPRKESYKPSPAPSQYTRPISLRRLA